MTDATRSGAASADSARSARAEAIRQAAIHEAPKHRRLFTSPRDGRILSALMLPDYALATPPGHGVLTTTGRRSGKARRKVIRAIQRGRQVFVVQLRPPAAAIEDPDAVSAWVRNIRANPNVRLKLGRRTFAGIAREIADPVELQQARAAICETVHLVDYAECALHLRGLPSRAKIRELHRYWFDTGIPLVLELTDPAGDAASDS